MNSILRIYVLSTLNVAAQHTDVLIVILDFTLDKSKQLMIRSIILSGLRVHPNRSREIYYSFDNR